MTDSQNAQTWLNTHFPNCKALDENWTFERYDYPEIVRHWIRNNWIKVSDDNGGTYHEPIYHREKFPHLYEKKTENPEEKQDADAQLEKEREFGENFKQGPFYRQMDEHNKGAVDVMASEGMEAAVKHMFTDQESGRQLSYSEMRMRYG